MNKLGIIAAAVASTVALASPVFAEWTEVDENVDGDTFYIDFDTVKENNGYLYFWHLQDLLKPDRDGDLSYKALNEVDCGTPRKYRFLSISYYTQPMGGGKVTEANTSGKWRYPKPDSVGESMTNAACDYAGK